MILLDEFQAMTVLDEHQSRRLKALADQYHHVSLVLAGSRQHLTENLVFAHGAPLYNMLERMSLGPIPEEDWFPFLLRRAQHGAKPFADETTARGLWDVAGPVPFDVQQLAYECFNEASDRITQRILVTATDERVRHQAARYAKVFERPSPVPRRDVKILALAPRLPRRTPLEPDISLLPGTGTPQPRVRRPHPRVVPAKIYGYCGDGPPLNHAVLSQALACRFPTSLHGAGDEYRTRVLSRGSCTSETVRCQPPPGWDHLTRFFAASCGHVVGSFATIMGPLVRQSWDHPCVDDVRIPLRLKHIGPQRKVWAWQSGRLL